MNSKILLLSIAVISVGLFAMPSTLSLFAGQHTFDAPAYVNCNKCHQDIYDEMTNAGKYGLSTAHQSTADIKACKGCHRTGTIGSIPLNKTNYSGSYSQNVSIAGAHAAVTMECAGCHSGVPAELMNASEGHGPYYNASRAESSINGTNMLTGANEACVGCHTHININITWRRSVGYNMIVNETTAGTYNISFTANNSVNISYAAGGNVTANQ